MKTFEILQAQYTIALWRSLIKKIIPLLVHTTEGAVMHKMSSFLFHMKSFRVRRLGLVKSMYSEWYFFIYYYTHNNKLEYEALDIHDMALKV